MLTLADGERLGNSLIVSSEGGSVAQESSLRVYPSPRAVEVRVPREYCERKNSRLVVMWWRAGAQGLRSRQPKMERRRGCCGGAG